MLVSLLGEIEKEEICERAPKEKTGYGSFSEKTAIKMVVNNGAFENPRM